MQQSQLFFSAGKESFAGAEGDSEASSNYPRAERETPSHDYSKMLAVHCKYPVTSLCKKDPNGGRCLDL